MSRPPRRFPYIATGLISLALGLLLGSFVFVVVVAVTNGSPTEGGLCTQRSSSGFRPASPEHSVVLLDKDWGGFPPRDRCEVYSVASARVRGETTVNHLIRFDPSTTKIADLSHPSNGEYVPIVVALLLPPVLWLLLVIGNVRQERWRSRRRPGSR